jgi:hypothetical protein
MNTIEYLQKWYQSQCDGDWEHARGVKIDTLDNPGWKVEIDLVGTALAGRAFSPLNRLGDESEWIRCEVRGDKFLGNGGPLMLEEIIRTFLRWAEAYEHAN